jgi:hypothetical protein
MYMIEELAPDVEVDPETGLPITRQQIIVTKPEPAPMLSDYAAGAEEIDSSEPKTASETYLATQDGQMRLRKVLHDSGYNTSTETAWTPVLLSKIEPGRTLTKFGETTLTEAHLHTRIREIAATLQAPATPKHSAEPLIKDDGFELRNPLVATRVRYIASPKQSYLLFIEGAMQVRAYGRSTEFRKMVGDDYYAANGFEGMKPYNRAEDTEYTIEPLQITWKEAGSASSTYFVLEHAVPFVVEAPEYDPLADWATEPTA